MMPAPLLKIHRSSRPGLWQAGRRDSQGQGALVRARHGQVREDLLRLGVDRDRGADAIERQLAGRIAAGGGVRLRWRRQQQRGPLPSHGQAQQARRQDGERLVLPDHRLVDFGTGGYCVWTCPCSASPCRRSSVAVACGAIRHTVLLLFAPAYSWANSFQCPSETTSTAPSTTLKAVSSSIA